MAGLTVDVFVSADGWAGSDGLPAGTSGRERFLDGVAAAELELVAHTALDGRVLLQEWRPTGRDVPRVS